MKPDKENDGCTDGDQRLPMDKARKIARMNKIRQIEGTPDTAPVVVSHQTHLAIKCSVMHLASFYDKFTYSDMLSVTPVMSSCVINAYLLSYLLVTNHYNKMATYILPDCLS